MKKRNIIMSACAAIAICVSLICGTTYALFTSESNTNIAVSSGKVNVVAELSDLKTYSKDVETRANTFELGGKASINGNTVELKNMMPGDKVTFKIKVTNKSTVDVKYKTMMETDAEGQLLMSALKFKLGETDYSKLIKYVSEWNALSGTEEEAGVTVKEMLAEIEMPLELGNEYQGKSCNIHYSVVAYQGNATVNDESVFLRSFVGTVNELKASLDYVSKNGGRLVLSDSIDFDQELLNHVQINENVTIDLNGKNLTFKGNTSKEIPHVFDVASGKEFVIQNGTIDATLTKSTYAVFATETNSKIVANNVTMTTNGTCFATLGDNASLELNGGSYAAPNAYVISTNASVINGEVDDSISIEAEGVQFEGNTPILVNVTGNYIFKNCIISAEMQGAVIRGGDALFENCEIHHVLTEAGIFYNYFDDKNWASGNEVNLAGITLGNKGGDAYQYPASCKLVNTTIDVMPELTDNSDVQFPAIYVWGNTGVGEGLDSNGNWLGATLDYEPATIKGAVILGNDCYKLTTRVDNTLDAQKALDEVKSNTTIYLKKGNYQALSFNQTKAASEVMSNIGTGKYRRTLKNVTICGEEGTVVDGFTLSTGHRYGTAGNPITDPITGVTTESTVNSYYSFFDVTNLKFENLNLTKSLYVGADSAQLTFDDKTVPYLKMDGLTMKSCHMKGVDKTNNAKENKLIHFAGGETSETLVSILIEDCSVDNAFHGVYSYGNRNLIVRNCTFTNLGHNAVQINGLGNVTVERNRIEGTSDRALRVGSFKGEVLFKDNVLKNACDSDGEIYKTGSTADITITFENNTYNDLAIANGTNYTIIKFVDNTLVYDPAL